MKQIRLWVIFWFTCILKLHANEAQLDPFSSSLTNTQNLLPTSVQSVSVISGEWLESETDFVVKGAEPLVLARSYSAEYSKGRLGFNWEFNRPHSLVVEERYSSDYSKTKLRARIHHPSGIKTIHEAEEKSVVLPLSRTKGLTNCSSMEISAKTNLHNIYLTIDKKAKSCEVITGKANVIKYELKEKISTNFAIIRQNTREKVMEMQFFMKEVKSRVQIMISRSNLDR